MPPADAPRPRAQRVSSSVLARAAWPTGKRKDHLTALIGAIVSQQLSTKAAATIFGRFVALFPDGAITSARAISVFDDQALRGVGLRADRRWATCAICRRASWMAGSISTSSNTSPTKT